VLKKGWKKDQKGDDKENKKMIQNKNNKKKEIMSGLP
jgi:hypothetical protein